MVRAAPEPRSAAGPPERALPAGSARGFWKAEMERVTHQDPAGSSVSISRVKGGQGHNLGVYFQGKEV